LVREDGSRCADIAEIKGRVENFYDSLFSSQPCMGTDMVLDVVSEKIIEDMNFDLCKSYSDEEIQLTLF
jgi:hypothetical protein